MSDSLPSSTTENPPSVAAPGDLDALNSLRVKRAARIYYQATRAAILLFAKPWFRVTFHGWQNMPKDGPVIVASNHASHIDPPILGACFRRQMGFLGKAELFKPPLGQLIRWLCAFPIKRGEGDRGAIRLVNQLLAAGWPVVVFPEGTRSPNGELQEPQLGIAMIIASNPEVPILPIRIEGSYRALGPGKSFPSPSKVRVVVGKPFTMKDIPELPTIKKQLYRALADETMKRIAQAGT